MNPKIEKWISQTTWNILNKTKQTFDKKGVTIYTTELITKIHKGYMKFLNIAFQTISIASISIALIWFFPTYLKVPYERMILIVLVLILLQLRFGKIKTET